VFDLKAVNPNVITKTNNRTLAQIIGRIEAQGLIVSDALAKLSALLAARE
jgi:type I restriction enzyme M protein